MAHIGIKRGFQLLDLLLGAVEIRLDRRENVIGIFVHGVRDGSIKCAWWVHSPGSPLRKNNSPGSQDAYSDT
jgi:hypothetical protein